MLVKNWMKWIHQIFQSKKRNINNIDFNKGADSNITFYIERIFFIELIL